MRLVAWNCNEGFRRKYPSLLELAPDVAVLSECGPFEPLLGEEREVTQVLRRGVDLPGHTKHLGVLAWAPWRVEALPPVPGMPWLLPTRVSGPLDLVVLAVWALGPEWAGGLSYAEQTARVAAQVVPTFAEPVVLAGDLNAPVAGTSGARRHAATAAALEGLGMLSAFTAARGDADPVGEPTLYHQRKEHQPFHIDHVFVPRAWTEDLEVSVGSYADWVATGRSDHVPVVVDLPGAVPPGPLDASTT